MNNIYNFEVRKFSSLKIVDIDNGNQQGNNEWVHYPQRSNISLNFMRYRNDNIHVYVSVIWKGNILEQVLLADDGKNLETWIAKYPFIGLKISSKEGKIKKRFQVGFANEVDFQNCCKCIKDLKFELRQPYSSNKNGIDETPNHQETGNKSYITTLGPGDSHNSISNGHNYVNHIQASQEYTMIPQHTPSKQVPCSQSVGSQSGGPQNFNNGGYVLYPRIENINPQLTIVPYLSPSPSQFMYMQPMNHNPVIFNSSNIPEESHPKNCSQVTKTQVIKNESKVREELDETITEKKLQGPEGTANLTLKLTATNNDVIIDKTGKSGLIKDTKKTPNEVDSNTQQMKAKVKKKSIYKLEDKELKKEIIKKLKDQNFIKLVEKLDKLVSNKEK